MILIKLAFLMAPFVAPPPVSICTIAVNVVMGSAPIQNVVLDVNNNQVATSSANIVYKWNITQVKPGNYPVMATATDSANLTGSASAVAHITKQGNKVKCAMQ
jgi:hypothetical protein